MNKRSDTPLDDVRLLELVRRVDPLAGAAESVPVREKTILARVLESTRRSSERRKFMSRKRALLIAIAVLVLGAVGVGVALGSGMLSGGEKKVLEVADVFTSPRMRTVFKRLSTRQSKSPITDIEVVAASEHGDAGVLQGEQDGIPVCLITIDEDFGLWVPVADVFNWGVAPHKRNLTVESGESGGPNSDLANKMMLAGAASSRVARVDLVSRDGTVRTVALKPMALGAKAFALEFDPMVVHPKLLIAYDEEGNQVERWDGGGLLAATDEHQDFCGRPGDMSCLRSSGSAGNRSKPGSANSHTSP